MDSIWTKQQHHLNLILLGQLYYNDHRDFIGRQALEVQKQSGVKHELVGLILHERGGVLRSHQKVQVNTENHGEITSWYFFANFK